MSTWMYQLIRHDGEIRLCEIYNSDGDIFYIPIGKRCFMWLITEGARVLRDLRDQYNALGIIPEGEFIKEQLIEMLVFKDV